MVTVTNSKSKTVSNVDNAVAVDDNTASGANKNTKVKVSVAGATGYVGQELIRLLLQHPAVETVSVASNSHSGESYEDLLPGFAGLAGMSEKLISTCESMDVDALAESSDVVFLALPHGVAGNAVKASALAKTKIIDMSGDFRLQNNEARGTWYGGTNESNAVASQAVYGLCELNRKVISKATLVANPGCFATAVILALTPLIKYDVIAPNSIIIDGKSGVSGAGRAATLKTHFNECNESIKAYQLPIHRHTPEIEQELGKFTDDDVITTFAAHLVPMNRGILITSYANLTKKLSNEEVQSIYSECYGQEPFIRIKPTGMPLPETRWVKGSNYCDIGFAVDERSNRIVVVSAIDNLIKGAAGQAVQNMNIILGIDETIGLNQIPTFL
jgi:N-acetyl-gamma-glutamyl-phosphate reductase